MGGDLKGYCIVGERVRGKKIEGGCDGDWDMRREGVKVGFEVWMDRNVNICIWDR